MNKKVNGCNYSEIAKVFVILVGLCLLPAIFIGSIELIKWLPNIVGKADATFAHPPLIRWDHIWVNSWQEVIDLGFEGWELVDVTAPRNFFLKKPIIIG